MKNKLVIKCPWCNRILNSKRSASHHFRYSHNKSVLDYFIETKGVKYVTCQYPGCNNIVKFQGGWKPNRTCCHSHQMSLMAVEGNHWYQSKNRKKDENGCDLIMKGVTERGNNPFSSKNRVHDENGNDIIARRSMESKLLSGIVNPITYKSGSRDVDPSKTSNVYVLIPYDLKYVKVGRSINSVSRINSLSEYIKVKDVVLFDTNEVTAAKVEAAVHKEFCKFICLDRSIINYSEWYDIDQLDNIVKFIKNFILQFND